MTTSISETMRVPPMVRVRLMWFMNSLCKPSRDCLKWDVPSSFWDATRLPLKPYVPSSRYLPLSAPDRRVLGVIRPTAEVVGKISQTGHIGVLATEGTIKSQSYNLEIGKLHPGSTIVGQACPMWVPLVENNEFDKPGADYFVKDSLEKLMAQDPLIDTIILGCTHYPLLLNKINQYLPKGVQVIPQGQYIATSLEDYLCRHPEMDQRLTRGGACQYLTTESATKFRESASLFLHEEVEVDHITLN